MNINSLLVIILLALAALALIKLTNVQQPAYLPTESSKEETIQSPEQISAITQPTTKGNKTTTTTEPFSTGPELNTTTGQVVSLDEVPDYVASSCGDAKCNAGENCESCSDCACQNTERCSTGGICLAKEYCSDNICTELEKKSQSCCSDCKCSVNFLCNENTQACLQIVQVTQAKLNQTIQKALSLPEFVNYTFYETYDAYYNNDVAKVVVLRCPGNPDFDCEAYLYLNASGDVIATDHTT